MPQEAQQHDDAFPSLLSALIVHRIQLLAAATIIRSLLWIIELLPQALSLVRREEEEIEATDTSYHNRFVA